MNKRRRYKAKRRRIINYWSRIFNLPWKYQSLGVRKQHGEFSNGLVRLVAAQELRKQGIFVGMYAKY